VLEDGTSLGLEHLGCVGARQAVVEGLLDGLLDAGAGLGGLLPVEGEEALEPRQQLAGDLLDLLALRGREVGVGPRQ
jgi:hypothetical protein